MNEKDINEKISSWFEAKPTEPASILDSSILATTPKGAWKFRFPEWQWQPLDYFHSEEANARLLEAMPFPLVKLVSTGRQRKPLKAWECWPNPTVNGNYEHVRHADRKTAIALAFVEFAGIEVTP